VRRAAIRCAVSSPSGRSRTRRFAWRAASGDGGVEVCGDLAHEPDPERRRGREPLARHEVAPCRPGADLGERERRDDGGQDPELHLGEGEHGVRVGDRDVRGGDQAAPASQGVAVNPGDDRRRALVDCAEHRPEPQGVLHVLLVREVGRRAHPLDVGAGREGRAVAGQHDRADVAHVTERVRQLADQVGVERVVPLGPRECHAQQMTVRLDPQRRHAAKS
jgi:hypothetical protein